VALERTVKGRQFAGRQISVVQTRIDGQLRSCHLLYLSGVTLAQVAAILEAVRGAPVLTVSDVDDFARRGGIAQMFVEDGKMRFELNLEARSAPASSSARSVLVLGGAGLRGAVTPMTPRPRSTHVNRVHPMIAGDEASHDEICRARSSWLTIICWRHHGAESAAAAAELSPRRADAPGYRSCFRGVREAPAGHEAPASVSFITAEEIARYGYRTLAEILRGVRGMYVTNDSQFQLFGYPRVRETLATTTAACCCWSNGHRVNDNVFGQAEIGAEFGSIRLFERVESSAGRRRPFTGTVPSSPLST
jgi:hypothetical protein